MYVLYWLFFPVLLIYGPYFDVNIVWNNIIAVGPNLNFRWVGRTNIAQMTWIILGSGEGSAQQSFRGCSAKVQPITFLYTIFERKGTPFTYLPWFRTLQIPLNCFKYTVFLVWINNYLFRKFCWLFHSHKKYLFNSFYRLKWQFFLPFNILQLVKSVPFYVKVWQTIHS